MRDKFLDILIEELDMYVYNAENYQNDECSDADANNVELECKNLILQKI